MNFFYTLSIVALCLFSFQNNQASQYQEPPGFSWGARAQQVMIAWSMNQVVCFSQTELEILDFQGYTLLDWLRYKISVHQQNIAMLEGAQQERGRLPVQRNRNNTGRQRAQRSGQRVSENQVSSNDVSRQRDNKGSSYVDPKCPLIEAMQRKQK